MMLRALMLDPPGVSDSDCAAKNFRIALDMYLRKGDLFVGVWV
jgi:hypothetical protein